MTDRCDILESKLQELVRDAFWEGWIRGLKRDSRFNLELYDEATHKLLVSYLDSSTSNVGTQDETSETRAVGDRVRPKGGLENFGFTRTPIEDAYDEIVAAINYRIPRGENIKPIGHCKLTEKPDGSIHASIQFGPTKPQVNGPI